MRWRRVTGGVLALLVAGGAPLGGARSPSAPVQVGSADSVAIPGSSLRVFLLTIGRGDAIWERFGHNALWVQDQASGWEAAYNWGIFSFDQVGFIPRLIRGTMLYKMAPYHPDSTLEDARRADRPVWIQELALTPAQRWKLLTFVEWNARPENRDYRYDYYRDNCSTRVRDALDRVLGGAIRAAAEGSPTAHSYRWHTRRLLRDVPLAYVGIQLVLGPRADRPLSAWEESFLPIRLMEELRAVRVPDQTGGLRPLVVQEGSLLGSTRPPEPSRPPFALPWFLAAGMLWATGLVAMGRRASGVGRLPGWLAFAAGAGWAVVAFLVGTLLLGAWALTDHTFWYSNLNLLQMNPAALPLAWAFTAFARQRPFPRWGRTLAATLGVVSVLGCILSLLPGLGQENGEILAFTVPVNLGVWAAARGAERGPPPTTHA